MIRATAHGSSLMAIAVVLGGCGLSIDLDPPDPPRALDASASDAGSGRDAGPGDAGPEADDAGPLDGGSIVIDAGAIDACAAAARVEICDGRDDDCDGAVDEGAVCLLPGAEASCVAGACAVDACAPDLGDCNGIADDGCEASLLSPESCGACATRCRAGAECAAGVCVASAVAITAGGVHTCALLSTGALACWGGNTLGQIGDGTTTERPTAVIVPGLTALHAASGGTFYSCAADRAGAAWCWGANADGQLGIGTRSSSVPSPTAVRGLTDATAITAGALHSCAALGAGGFACWGRNGSGQLGNGSFAESSAPVRAGASLGALSSISAGTGFTCAIDGAGAVYCWGANNLGQLGAGSTSTTNAASPLAITGSVNARQVDAGAHHACARGSDGSIWCWGSNSAGQAGGPVSSWSVDTPVRIGALTGAVDVCAGASHSCAALRPTGVACWGDNAFGQLGRTGPEPNVGRVVGLDVAITDVACGAQHTCAVSTAGEVYCWGSNVLAQLGDGSHTSSSTPVRALFEP